MFKKIVIFGVGLIGGSVALALKQTANPPYMVGVGRQSASLHDALALGLVDAVETDLAVALKDAQLVLIATPVAQTPAILASIKPYMTPEMVITDAGSTKSDVMQAAKATLGEYDAQFVGGHPIAGAEKSGPSAAFATLYQGKNIVLTPAPSTAPHAVALVTQLWQACGGVVSQMSAATHDQIFAAVSHLPHLLAFALVDSFAKRADADLLFKFAASGFRDFTRIAGSHPEMWRDIALANQAALLNEIDAYQHALSQLRELLAASDGDGLFERFAHASHARNHWAPSNT